jgi:Flp pilus assembly protein TadD
MNQGARYLFIFVCTALLAGFGHTAFAATQSCASCHRQESARFLATAMGKSLIPPEHLSPARITHDRSRSVITVERRNGKMIHSISEQGLTAEYPVRYQMGGGLMGASYLVQLGDYLFESPASWFKSYGWDVSPGYEAAPLVDFDRPMSDTCLFCHAGAARFSDADGRRLKGPPLGPITCEQCHGPGDGHALHPSAKNIVNPAKLAPAARNSICEQCHLEAAGRILNPGKHWDDFRPGEPAEKTFATYMLVGGDKHEVIAVSQVEQLAESKCAQMSADKLWCGTCHQPHGEVAKDRHGEMRGVCTSCHTTLSAASHPAGQPECTSCHMPQSSTTNVAHAALTDHRILRRPADAVRVQEGEQRIVAWREPSPEVRDRDLALGEILAAISKNLPVIENQGFDLLKTLPPEQRRNDPEVLSALEGLYLQSGNLDKAVEFGRLTVEQSPQSAKSAMNFGLVLQRSGDLAGAEQKFTRAIELDPSLKPAYSQLARLYASQGRTREMTDIVDRYLKWNPQDIMFRMQKAQKDKP